MTTTQKSKGTSPDRSDAESIVNIYSRFFAEIDGRCFVADEDNLFSPFGDEDDKTGRAIIAHLIQSLRIKEKEEIKDGKEGVEVGLSTNAHTGNVIKVIQDILLSKSERAFYGIKSISFLQIGDQRRYIPFIGGNFYDTELHHVIKLGSEEWENLLNEVILYHPTWKIPEPDWDKWEKGEDKEKIAYYESLLKRYGHWFTRLCGALLGPQAKTLDIGICEIGDYGKSTIVYTLSLAFPGTVLSDPNSKAMTAQGKKFSQVEKDALHTLLVNLDELNTEDAIAKGTINGMTDRNVKIEPKGKETYIARRIGNYVATCGGVPTLPWEEQGIPRRTKYTNNFHNPMYETLPDESKELATMTSDQEFFDYVRYRAFQIIKEYDQNDIPISVLNYRAEIGINYLEEQNKSPEEKKTDKYDLDAEQVIFELKEMYAITETPENRELISEVRAEVIILLSDLGAEIPEAVNKQGELVSTWLKRAFGKSFTSTKKSVEIDGKKIQKAAYNLTKLKKE